MKFNPIPDIIYAELFLLFSKKVEEKWKRAPPETTCESCNRLEFTLEEPQSKKRVN